MRKIFLITVAAWIFAASSLLSSATDKPAMPPPALKVGDVAPDFKLNYFDGGDLKEVSLGQYRGKKNVVLAFYIFAFTGG